MTQMALMEAHSVIWKCKDCECLNLETIPCKTSEKFIRNSLALAACRDNTQREKRKRRREEEDRSHKRL